MDKQTKTNSGRQINHVQPFILQEVESQNKTPFKHSQHFPEVNDHLYHGSGIIENKKGKQQMQKSTFCKDYHDLSQEKENKTADHQIPGIKIENQYLDNKDKDHRTDYQQQAVLTQQKVKGPRSNIAIHAHVDRLDTNNKISEGKEKEVSGVLTREGRNLIFVATVATGGRENFFLVRFY